MVRDTDKTGTAGKWLMVVGGGHETIYGLERARAMGVHTVVSDRDPQAPAFALADERIVCDTYSIDRTVELAQAFHHQRHELAGVLSMSSDVPMTVATVAEALRLPGIGIAAARIAADKWAQKLALWRAGLPTPFGFIAESAEQVLEYARHWLLVDWIIKPADSRGARGVLRLARNDLHGRYLSAVGVQAFLDTARGYSPTGRVICEEWIRGPQISTETVLCEHTVGFLDRNYDRLEEFSPYIVEDGASQPSTLSAAKRLTVATLAQRAATALGFTHIAKGDIVYGPDGPMVIEMAARLSGGLMSSVQVPAATGVDLVGVAIKLALGETPTVEELTRTKHEAVAMRFFFPDPGQVTTVTPDCDRVVALSANILASRVPKVGDIVGPYTDHTKRAGYVVAKATSRAGAIHVCERFIKACGVRTCQPSPSGSS